MVLEEEGSGLAVQWGEVSGAEDRFGVSIKYSGGSIVLMSYSSSRKTTIVVAGSKRKIKIGSLEGISEFLRLGAWQ